jgi:hypothetical protein
MDLVASFKSMWTAKQVNRLSDGLVRLISFLQVKLCELPLIRVQIDYEEIERFLDDYEQRWVESSRKVTSVRDKSR